ncbi:MAG: flagellin [Bdellovibrionales bacterium RIFCSPHIGHO2_01_FULL_40_29]|nr:MAG: flagellin [Bdellovibrionales bacterium RIFCSPHIGHO2_01_FULL_40_29]OFZ35166.1 MAG: flagellin [Bdellovibrionales bacterium RIFCSPHIGHO2_02_FULL_40_15]
MGMRIATNVPALNTQKNLYGLNNENQTTMARLSSGFRINKASDDAAGLAISENLKAQIRGFRQANRNANDGISLVQVAEGGLSEVGNMLIRLRELGVQAASDTIGDRERAFVDIEYQQLKEEIDRVAQTTQFNGTPLLNGMGGVLDIQIGVNNQEFEDRITFDAEASNASLESMMLAEQTVATKLDAQNSLGFIDEAINYVNGMRANFGAIQNRLQTVSQTLMTTDENFSAANSRIRDTDIAEESSRLARNSVLMQAATSVLSQANQQQQLALKLLG